MRLMCIFIILRIIPARAGFTALQNELEGRMEDHPRSRGVYQSTWKGISGEEGSSPLARGLRRDNLCILNLSRIIPARAGFTLARKRLPQHKIRIIPARAGFTSTATRRDMLNQDHPRSRGVYLKPLRRILRILGSSPLARGLRLTEPSTNSLTRIIPARAGFTERGHMGIAAKKDHPRSRGVYPVTLLKSCLKRGSSPLARGLLECVVVCACDRGIIPARAGFTMV